MSYTKGEVRTKLIHCHCGEKVVVEVGFRAYMTNDGRRNFPTRAESEGEVVGFSHHKEWVRIRFDGNKKGTVSTMAFSFFHHSPEHRQWEKENR